MRILLFGKDGQVGSELQRALAPLGEVVAPRREQVDFLDLASLSETVRRLDPQLIVNAAAYTDVNEAEKEEEIAKRVNAEAVSVLAAEAAMLGAAIVHYSTDYVFDGLKGSAYDESDTPNPINAYGRSKLLGEAAIRETDGAFLILRTGWVYNFRGDNFVTKVLRWAREQREMRIVVDQVGSPTWARWLAEATAQILAGASQDPLGFIGDRAGIYHLSCAGATSRYEWAQAILHRDAYIEEQVVEQIIPARSAEFPEAAKRPPFSALDSSLARQVFELEIDAWQAVLDEAIGHRYSLTGSQAR